MDFSFLFTEAAQGFWSELIKLAINGILGVLLVLLAPVILQIRKWVLEKLTETQRSNVEAIIRTLVLAAEQTGFKDELLESGNAKKQWVVSEAQRLLREQGYTRWANDVPFISNAVEAFVYELLNQFGKAEFEAVELDPDILRYGSSG